LRWPIETISGRSVLARYCSADSRRSLPLSDAVLGAPALAGVPGEHVQGAVGAEAQAPGVVDVAGGDAVEDDLVHRHPGVVGDPPALHLHAVGGVTYR
jgi:hypothetical protein